MIEQSKTLSGGAPKKDVKNIPNNSEKHKNTLKPEKKAAEQLKKKKEETKIPSKEPLKKEKEPPLNTSKILPNNKTQSKQNTKKVAEEVYNIETLVKKKGSKYLVKWENYPPDQNTWEPRASIPQFILQVIRLFCYSLLHTPGFSIMRRIQVDLENLHLMGNRYVYL